MQPAAVLPEKLVHILILIRISRSLIRPMCLKFFCYIGNLGTLKVVGYIIYTLMLVLGAFDHELDRVIPRISF
jgi:hypothetical protein